MTGEGKQGLGDPGTPGSLQPRLGIALAEAGPKGTMRTPDPGAARGRVGALKAILKPAAWAFYMLIVFEILFMVSPLALHFYASYGPVLNFIHQWPAAAWLTQFFLPHFSRTTSPVLNALPGLGWLLALGGAWLFLPAAIPLYGAKLLRRGVVTGGLYAILRHPQYVALAVVGLGTVLIWPRFLVLLSYVTMLFLYVFLARWEEEQCLARFGESYRQYRARTGMFLPLRFSPAIPRILPAVGWKRALAAAGIYGTLLAATLGLAFGLRDFSLSRISASFSRDVAVISPAPLNHQELAAAYRVAAGDPDVRGVLRTDGATKLIVYVVPRDWYLPDLPMEAVHRPGGHRTPPDFDRRHYTLLFTRARTHAAHSAGSAIVKTAYGRDPILLVRVDTSAERVTGIETPPPYVVWGDIPTPMF